MDLSVSKMVVRRKNKRKVTSLHNSSRLCRNNTLNSTAVRQTLKTNNRALARALEQVRQELADTKKKLIEGFEEKQALQVKYSALEKVAGLKNEEIEAEVKERIKFRLSEIRDVLKQTTGSMLGTVDLIHSAMAHCETSRDSYSMLETSPNVTSKRTIYYTGPKSKSSEAVQTDVNTAELAVICEDTDGMRSNIDERPIVSKFAPHIVGTTPVNSPTSKLDEMAHEEENNRIVPQNEVDTKKLENKPLSTSKKSKLPKSVKHKKKLEYCETNPGNVNDKRQEMSRNFKLDTEQEEASNFETTKEHTLSSCFGKEQGTSSTLEKRKEEDKADGEIKCVSNRRKTFIKPAPVDCKTSVVTGHVENPPNVQTNRRETFVLCNNKQDSKGIYEEGDSILLETSLSAPNSAILQDHDGICNTISSILGGSSDISAVPESPSVISTVYGNTPDKSPGKVSMSSGVVADNVIEDVTLHEPEDMEFTTVVGDIQYIASNDQMLTKSPVEAQHYSTQSITAPKPCGKSSTLVKDDILQDNVDNNTMSSSESSEGERVKKHFNTYLSKPGKIVFTVGRKDITEISTKKRNVKSTLTKVKHSRGQNKVKVLPSTSPLNASKCGLPKSVYDLSLNESIPVPSSLSYGQYINTKGLCQPDSDQTQSEHGIMLVLGNGKKTKTRKSRNKIVRYADNLTKDHPALSTTPQQNKKCERKVKQNAGHTPPRKPLDEGKKKKLMDIVAKHNKGFEADQQDSNNTRQQRSLGNRRDSENTRKKKGVKKRKYLSEAFESSENEEQDSKSRDSETTRQQSRDSETTRQQRRDSETTRQQSRDSETTRQQSRDSETTRQQSRDSETTRQQSRDSETTRQQRRDSETTRQQSRDSETTRQQSRDSETTRQQSRNSETTRQQSRDSETSRKKIGVKKRKYLSEPFESSENEELEAKNRKDKVNKKKKSINQSNKNQQKRCSSVKKRKYQSEPSENEEYNQINNAAVQEESLKSAGKQESLKSSNERESLTSHTLTEDKPKSGGHQGDIKSDEDETHHMLATTIKSKRKKKKTKKRPVEMVLVQEIKDEPVSYIEANEDLDKQPPQINEEEPCGRRSRRGTSAVSYKEPSLTAKLRRGDPISKTLYEGKDAPHIFKDTKENKKSFGTQRKRSALTIISNVVDSP